MKEGLCRDQKMQQSCTNTSGHRQPHLFLNSLRTAASRDGTDKRGMGLAHQKSDILQHSMSRQMSSVIVICAKSPLPYALTDTPASQRARKTAMTRMRPTRTGQDIICSKVSRIFAVTLSDSEQLKPRYSYIGVYPIAQPVGLCINSEL